MVHCSKGVCPMKYAVLSFVGTTIVIVIGLVLVLSVFVIGIYNGLVGLSNRVKNSYAQIDVQLSGGTRGDPERPPHSPLLRRFGGKALGQTVASLIFPCRNHGSRSPSPHTGAWMTSPSGSGGNPDEPWSGGQTKNKTTRNERSYARRRCS